MQNVGAIPLSLPPLAISIGLDAWKNDEMHRIIAQFLALLIAITSIITNMGKNDVKYINWSWRVIVKESV